MRHEAKPSGWEPYLDWLSGFKMLEFFLPQIIAFMIDVYIDPQDCKFNGHKARRMRMTPDRCRIRLIPVLIPRPR